MSVTWGDAPRRVEGRRLTSARQRVVVLTFKDEDAARAWDEAGQPVSVP